MFLNFQNILRKTLKIVNQCDENSIKEANNLLALKHENIVKCYEKFVDNKHRFFLLTEFCNV